MAITFTRTRKKCTKYEKAMPSSVYVSIPRNLCRGLLVGYTKRQDKIFAQNSRIQRFAPIISISLPREVNLFVARCCLKFTWRSLQAATSYVRKLLPSSFPWLFKMAPCQEKLFLLTHKEIKFDNENLLGKSNNSSLWITPLKSHGKGSNGNSQDTHVCGTKENARI